MTTEPARRAYQAFAAALTAWWETPSAQRVGKKMPQPGDFTGSEIEDGSSEFGSAPPSPSPISDLRSPISETLPISDLRTPISETKTNQQKA